MATAAIPEVELDETSTLDPAGMLRDIPARVLAFGAKSATRNTLIAAQKKATLWS
jgi:hypothetical protein